MTVIELLQQDQIWIDREGNEHWIAEMPSDYRDAVRNFLLKRAVRIAYVFDLKYPLPDPDFCGDMAYASLESQQLARAEDPQGWLRGSRLYKALDAGS